MHASRLGCPDRPALSGREKQNWRVAVETPRGVEGYGVLLAQSGRGWLSRIVTYPNVLWRVPGGGAALSFVGHTEEEATRQAVAFVREHCRARGYRMRDELSLSGGERRVWLPSDAAACPPRDLRVARVLPVRFGRSRPVVCGRTGNLSEGGLFVATQYPMTEKDPVGLMLEMEQGKVPLRGSVVWHCQTCEPGRQPGMGVRLLEPPEVYLRYVRALR